MKNSKDRKRGENKTRTNAVKELFYELPQLQFDYNKEVVIEGSKGVLEYTQQLIRINTSAGLMCFYGKSLNLKCISSSELIINGYIEKVDFIA